VYVNCGLPAQRILPLTLVIPKLHEALRFYWADLELSDRNWTLKPWIFSPTAQEMAVSASLAFGKPALAEIATDSTETDWNPIDIVDIQDLELYEREGKRGVAIFGDPKRLKFSWDPTISSQRVKISYDEILPEPQAIDTQIAALPEYYIPMVAARVALDCMADIIDRDPSRAAAIEVREGRLTVRLAEWERKWDNWRATPDQQAPMTRPAFNRNRNGWARGGWIR
jgi:hypothetical protein